MRAQPLLDVGTQDARLAARIGFERIAAAFQPPALRAGQLVAGQLVQFITSQEHGLFTRRRRLSACLFFTLATAQLLGL